MLADRAESSGSPFVAFDKVDDHDRYVDGRSRADGTRSFLAARGIHLPEGTEKDPPAAMTISGISNRKNELLLARLARDGVALAGVEADRAGGFAVAVGVDRANHAAELAAHGADLVVSDLAVLLGDAAR